ncbi:hypothetical protein [Alkalicoccus saliphilus]|uniref:hypothetical protein n=1 Tax=Alkalicoccus saliphilus TaxID=200989 RepID=UPI0013584D92|nr:hypothetical protein [Alkalicoccus saliphilus]
MTAVVDMQIVVVYSEEIRERASAGITMTVVRTPEESKKRTIQGAFKMELDIL